MGMEWAASTSLDVGKHLRLSWVCDPLRSVTPAGAVVALARTEGFAMTSDEIIAPAADVGRTLDAIDGDTRRALAALHDAPDEVAELAIATLGYWVRVGLATTGVIERFESDDEGTDAAKERPVEIKLTGHGRHVLAACSQVVGEDPDLEDRMQRLREAREEYLADGDRDRYVHDIRDAVA
jgi:hypothetical protein